MNYLTFKSKNNLLRFESFDELNIFLKVLDKKANKWITVCKYEKGLLKVMNSYMWNGVTWEPTSVDMKTLNMKTF